MKADALKLCPVCQSGNLNEFTGTGALGSYPIWWCEDCGSLHKRYFGESITTWQPEHSMLHHQVLAFHRRFGQSIGERPHVPDEKTVRFRLSLVLEEVIELIDAAGYHIYAAERGSVEAGDLRQNKIHRDVDLPAFVDALADLMYVIEGAAITMGVNMMPILAEVQRANLAKLPSYVAAKDASHRRDDDPCGCDLLTSGMVHDPSCWKAAPPVKRADGKILKPEGWKPPDIEGELHAQGWRSKCIYCGVVGCTQGCRT